MCYITIQDLVGLDGDRKSRFVFCNVDTGTNTESVFTYFNWFLVNDDHFRLIIIMSSHISGNSFIFQKATFSSVESKASYFGFKLEISIPSAQRIFNFSFQLIYIEAKKLKTFLVINYQINLVQINNPYLQRASAIVIFNGFFLVFGTEHTGVSVASRVCV
ncbi:hypothetical protein D3C85_1464170 [compost metagenome]